MNHFSRIFAIGKSNETDKEKDKKNTISLAQKQFPTWDAEKAKELLEQIKNNPSLKLCRNAIGKYEMDMVSSYIDGTDTFKSIEEIADASYNLSY